MYLFYVKYNLGDYLKDCPPFRSVDYEACSRQCLLSVKWSGTIKVSLPCYIKGYTYAEKGTVTIFLNKIYVYYNLIDKLIG